MPPQGLSPTMTTFDERDLEIELLRRSLNVERQTSNVERQRSKVERQQNDQLREEFRQYREKTDLLIGQLQSRLQAFEKAGLQSQQGNK